MAAGERILKRPLWIIAGQLGVVFAVFVGFGATGPVRPKVAIACVLCTLIGAVAFGPVGRVNRLVVTAPVVALVFWWFTSYLWTFNVFGWWTDTQLNMPFILGAVILIALLPTDAFRGALLAGCYLAIAYTVFELVVQPGTATVNPDGVAGWRGAFEHKNEMGPFMVFAVLVLTSFERASRRRAVAVAAACVLVVGSRSTTALGAGLVTLIVVAMLSRLARSDRKARASIVVSSLAGAVAGWLLYSTVVTAILDVSGEDTTLTGRTEIWTGVWRSIRERPWQGYGIGGVWSDPSAQPANSIMSRLGFTVFHAHNGYLEMLLLLGGVGLAILVWLMVSVVRLSLSRLYRDTTAAVFAVGYVVLMAVLSISEVAVFGIWLGLLCALQTAAARDSRGLGSASGLAAPGTRALGRSLSGT